MFLHIEKKREQKPLGQTNGTSHIAPLRGPGTSRGASALVIVQSLWQGYDDWGVVRTPSPVHAASRDYFSRVVRSVALVSVLFKI